MFHTSALAVAGFSRAEIDQQRVGHEQLRRGVYVPRDLDPLDRYKQLCAAVIASLQPGAMLTGPSAALLLGVPIPGAPPKQVFVRGVPRGGYADDIRVLNGDAESIRRSGLPVAEPAVVAADCARLLSPRDALIVADCVLHERMCTAADLDRVTQQGRGSRGAPRLRWLAQNAEHLSESPGETWTRLVLGDLGFAANSQVTIQSGDFRARVDFLLADGRTVVEFDGLIKYRDPDGVGEVVADEKERQARLEALGYRVLRVMWSQLRDPQRLARRLFHAGARPTVPALRLPAGWCLVGPS